MIDSCAAELASLQVAPPQTQKWFKKETGSSAQNYSHGT